MELKIRNIPDDIDAALRRRAAAEGRSLNDVALEALLRGAAAAPTSEKRRDLSQFAGSWATDPATEAALREQDQIDPDLWR
jgi:plasmid stability protein